MTISVQTSAGRLIGSLEQNGVVFRGVAYAAPPVAESRWRSPAPVAAWRGEREALAFGDRAPQLRNPDSEALGLETDHPGSEDCLTLNVFTPACDGSRRPVLVWIPGGAFISGSPATPLYDGSRLAARGDAVVVTVSYRVGALGFLHLGPGPEGCNFGLQDQLAALGWVKREIARFGGDPECVTVFGESAGAGSLIALLAMPASRGLFQRAIVQSAAPDGVIDATDASERARRLLAKLGCTAADRKALEEIEVAKLLEAQAELFTEQPWKTGMLFAPVIDGDLLPRRPLEAIADGSAADVALLIGTTRDEMRFYAGGPFEPGDAEVARKLLAAQAPGGSAAAADRVYEVTRAARAARGEATGPADVYYAAQTDLYMRVPAARVAEGHARHQPATFVYSFEWSSPARGGSLGACHAIDLPFTFGTLDAPGVAAFAGAGPEAERLSGQLMDAWLAFARDGDPSHADIGSWPRYTPDRRATLRLGPHGGVVDAPFEAERSVWMELFDAHESTR